MDGVRRPVPQRDWCQVRLGEAECGASPDYEVVVRCPAVDDLAVRSLCTGHAHELRAGWERAFTCRTCPSGTVVRHHVEPVVLRTHRGRRDSRDLEDPDRLTG